MCCFNGRKNAENAGDAIKDVGDVQRHFVLQEKDVQFFSQQSLADSVLLMRERASCTHTHILFAFDELCCVMCQGITAYSETSRRGPLLAEGKEAANDGKMKMIKNEDVHFNEKTHSTGKVTFNFQGNKSNIWINF